jgi:hypothetical protein
MFITLCCGSVWLCCLLLHPPLVLVCLLLPSAVSLFLWWWWFFAEHNKKKRSCTACAAAVPAFLACELNSRQHTVQGPKRAPVVGWIRPSLAQSRGEL